MVSELEVPAAHLEARSGSQASGSARFAQALDEALRAAADTGPAFVVPAPVALYLCGPQAVASGPATVTGPECPCQRSAQAPSFGTVAMGRSRCCRRVSAVAALISRASAVLVVALPLQRRRRRLRWRLKLRYLRSRTLTETGISQPPTPKLRITKAVLITGFLRLRPSAGRAV